MDYYLLFLYCSLCTPCFKDESSQLNWQVERQEMLCDPLWSIHTVFLYVLKKLGLEAKSLLLTGRVCMFSFHSEALLIQRMTWNTRQDLVCL